MKIFGKHFGEIFSSNSPTKYHFLTTFFLYALTGCGEIGNHDKKIANSCEKESIVSKSIPNSLSEEFHGIRYTVDVYSFGANGTCVRNITKAPEHAAHFGSGILLGGDRGEWGGELVFRDQRNQDKKLIDENVKGIFPSATEAFVFTGLNHLGSNSGAVYVVTLSQKNEALIPKKIMDLEIAPDSIEFNKDIGFRLIFDSTGNFSGRPKNQQSVMCYSISGGKKFQEISCSEKWNSDK